MEDSSYIYASTAKLFVQNNFRSIPSYKSTTRTRLFDGDDGDQIPGMEMYKEFARVFGGTSVSIDRTHTIKTPFNTTLHPSMEMRFGAQKSFSDCCNERAVSCLTSGKYINVLYGGGIDSVTMLSALLRNGVWEQINVLLTNNSIVRNPSFYEKHICGKLNTIPAYDFHNYLGKKDSLLISGACGDELFGSTNIQNFMYRSEKDLMVEKPTTSLIVELLNRNPIIETPEETTQRNRMVEMLFSVVGKCPVPIDTVYKFFWWLNFALNWNVAHSTIPSYTLNRVAPEVDYIPFFSTDDFQAWSVANCDALSIEKKAAVEYIHEYDATPLHTTVKTTNIPEICFNKPRATAIGVSMDRYHSLPSNIFLTGNSFV